MEYTIRSADKEHLEKLPSIERAAADSFTEEDLPLALRSDVTPVETLIRAQQNGRVWVALDDLGNPIGYLFADIVDGNFHIMQMDVLPRHSRKGIGTRLLRAAIQSAAASSYERITLTTFHHVPWNAPFYRAHGFVIMAEDQCGQGLSAILAKERQIGLRNRVAMCRVAL